MQKNELTLSGTVVVGDDFEAKDGYVVIENGEIKEIGEGKRIPQCVCNLLDST